MVIVSSDQRVVKGIPAGGGGDFCEGGGLAFPGFSRGKRFGQKTLDTHLEPGYHLYHILDLNSIMRNSAL